MFGLDPVHAHLMLSHVPVLGVGFGLALVAFALATGRQETLRVGLAVLALAGIAAVVVYLSGEAAEEIAEELARISEAAIEAHEEAGVIAAWAAGLLGAAALAGLWAFRSRPAAGWYKGSMLVAALAVSGLMAWTANLGGRIGHPEIGGAAVPSVRRDGEESERLEELERGEEPERDDR